jgi:tetratricopeptide (TPR) repeat protein
LIQQIQRLGAIRELSLLNLDNYEDALQNLQKSIDLDSRDENIWFGKGMCLFKLGKLNEALSCMNKSIEVHSKANTGGNENLGETT